MIINLFIIKLYLGEYKVYGIEFFSFSRGKCLLGLTIDIYKESLDIYLDIGYTNIWYKEIKTI